jgi:hypothetical protein
MNKSKTTKKIRRTKSTSPRISEKVVPPKVESKYPEPSQKVREAFLIIEGFGPLDIARLCGVGVQDLGIIDPMDGWANGLQDLHERFKKTLFDAEGKVQKRFIAPALELEKHVSTGEVPLMLTSICMMAGVLAFVEFTD